MNKYCAIKGNLRARLLFFPLAAISRFRKGRMDYVLLTFFIVSALIFYAGTLLIIDDLGLSIYETIHRQSIWHTVRFASLSGIRTNAALSILSSSQVLLSFLLCSSDKEKRMTSILSGAQFVSLAMYIFFGKPEALLISSLLLSYFTLKNRINIAIYVNFLLLLTSVLESLSLIAWLFYPLSPPESMNYLSFLSYLDREVFYSLNALLGYPLLLVLLFSWVLAFLMSYMKRVKKVKLERYKVRITLMKKNNNRKQALGRTLELTRGILFDARFAFLSSLIALLYLSFYSYAPMINPTGKFTNVDGILYSSALDRFEAVLQGNGNYESLKKMHGGERLASTLLLFAIKNLLKISSVEAVKIGCFIASAFLVFSTYMSLRLVFKDSLLSLLSVYLTTLSTQTVVGLYAGYLSNWLASSLLILMSAFAISGVEEHRLKHLAISAILSIIALFTHPWSWFVYTVAITLFFFALMSFDSSMRKSKKIPLLLAFSFLVLSFAMDYAKNNYLGFIGGIQSDILLIRSMSIVNLFLFPRNANYTLQIFVGGYLSNYLIFFLSVVGIASLFKSKEKASWFLITLNFVISMPVFFLSPNIQARLLYLMPLNIYSAFGCSEVLKFAKKKGINENLLLMLILLLLANYSFRSVANLI